MTKTVEVINKIAINDPLLIAMVAKASWGAAAIYDDWQEMENKYPCIVITWSTAEGNHWGRRDSLVDFDIFTQGNSGVIAEDIKDRIIELYDQQIFESDESGPIRMYLGSDFKTPEDTPKIIHWNVQFKAIHWRKSFISQMP